MAGIRKAQKLGRYSRGKSIDYDLILALKEQGLSKSKIARTAGISRMSVYRIFEWIDTWKVEEQEKNSWDIDLSGERIVYETR